MSDELKKNYEIFEIDAYDCHYLVLRRFCHSSEQQREAIIKELLATGYKGWILFDNLFKGGNTSQRYGKQFFDKEFMGMMYCVEVPKDSPLRAMVSHYLKENHLIEGTSLTEHDIQTVLAGGVI